jgi:hypothetical protein
MGGSKWFAIITLPILFVIITAINIKPVWNALLAVMPKKLRSIVERIGTVRLIMLAVAAAVYAVICWLTHGILLIVTFAAVAAYGVAAHKNVIKLGGAACLFLSVWAVYGLLAAFISTLVLSALDYLRDPDSVTCAIGAICFIGVVAYAAGGLCAFFCTLIILLTAAAANAGQISDLIIKLKETKGKIR